MTRRRVVFTLATVFVVAIAVEAASFLILTFLDGRPSAWRGLADHRLTAMALGEPGAAAGDDANGEIAPVTDWTVEMRGRQAVHPYLGYVEIGRSDWTIGSHPFHPDAASYGFPRNFHPLLEEMPADGVLVVVLGGSVAQQIAGNGGHPPLLQRTLAGLSRFQGRPVRVLNLGLGGYKQPQQLFTLTYFLSLGMRPDIVINVDGFNEVALPIHENLEIGVFPFFPRAWRFRLGDHDPRELEVRGAVLVTDEMRRRAATFADRVPIRLSLTAGLVWRLIDDWLAAVAARQQARLLEAGPGERNLQAQGPEFNARSSDDVYLVLTEQWRQSSLQLHRLATANGVEYFHFLQPNQYDDGSKPLTLEERRRAWDPDSALREGALRGYPLLRRQGEALRREGVHFVDLSQVFATTDETVYIDTCCHLNIDGVTQLVDRIAAAVGSAPGSSGEPTVAAAAQAAASVQEAAPPPG